MKKIIDIANHEQLKELFGSSAIVRQKLERTENRIKNLISKYQNLQEAFWEEVYKLERTDKNKQYRIKNGTVYEVEEKDVDYDVDLMVATFQTFFGVDDTSTAKAIVKEVIKKNIPGALNIFNNHILGGKKLTVGEQDNVIKFEKDSTQIDSEDK